jgi:hypothetical protein
MVLAVGATVSGWASSATVGLLVFGVRQSIFVGDGDTGEPDERPPSSVLVGSFDRTREGTSDGITDGESDGTKEGKSEGRIDGVSDGSSEPPCINDGKSLPIASIVDGDRVSGFVSLVDVGEYVGGV